MLDVAIVGSQRHPRTGASSIRVCSHDWNFAQQRTWLPESPEILRISISVHGLALTSRLTAGTCRTKEGPTNPTLSMVNGWLGREGSNLRMPESKSGALPLGDAPKERQFR